MKNETQKPYERVDRTDGTRTPITREELAQRLSKRYSLVDEEIARADAGHVLSDDFAWYQRTLVPGVRGTATQNEEAAALEKSPASEHVVNYGNKFYLITSAGNVTLDDCGHNIAEGEMTSEEAIYEVLCDEGEDVERPESTPLNILGALLELRHEAEYFVKRMFSGEYIARSQAAKDEMVLLETRIKMAVSAANVAIFQHLDAATPTPKLAKELVAREDVIYHRLRVAVISEILQSGEELTGIEFYSRGCIEHGGVPVNSIMVICYEFAPWFEDFARETLADVFKEFGFEYMMTGEELTLHPLGRGSR